MGLQLLRPPTSATEECEREPIHAPGAIQPHGALLVLEEPSLCVLQASADAARQLAMSSEQLLGSSLFEIFERQQAADFGARAAQDKLAPPNHLLATFTAKNGGNWTARAHRWDGVLLLELQRASELSDSGVSLQAAIRKTIADLDASVTLPAFCQSAADHFRELTQFDRVMIYRFLPDQSGAVIAESRQPEMEPFLGLRYPASDIPAQARRLYLLSPYRLTADVDAVPVPLHPPLNPKTGKPLDMSYCALRSTSPFHLEYLRDMGVRASLSFSIVREGKLWGLVACHNRTPKALSEDTRDAGEILARILGLQVGIKEDLERTQYGNGLAKAHEALAERLQSSGDFVYALVTGDPNLLTGMDASGAALCTASRTFRIGRTPELEQIERIRDWLSGREWQAVWSTDALVLEFEEARNFGNVASGTLAIRLAPGSPEAVLWFRPELVETVRWAGGPQGALDAGTPGSSTRPKRSFQLWQEQVRDHSAPWLAVELSHAAAIRENMAQALLGHRALEINRLNAELLRSNRELEIFSAIASHDLQEPLRTITLYTELLFRQGQLGDSEKVQQQVQFVREAAARMSRLVRSLLEYAQAGNDTSQSGVVDLGSAVAVALENLEARMAESNARIETGDLPQVRANRELVIQLLQNLISNALKYSKPGQAPMVRVGAEKLGGKWLISVADNGIGFDPTQVEKIFEPFRRLHGRELSGTGLGLAICRRIVESCGGEIWAETQLGVGSKFMFTLVAA